MKATAGAVLVALFIAGMARAADLLIILNKSDNTASILDAKTGAARATVPVGKGPHEVEVLAGRQDRRRLQLRDAGGAAGAR